MSGRGRGRIVALVAACAAATFASSAQALTSVADLGTLGSLGVRWDGAAPGNELATAISVGDANGDGRKDALIGAPGANGGTGAAYLVLGSTSITNIADIESPPAGVTVITYDGVAAGDRTGTIVELFDVTGDSRDDVIIGAPQADPLGRGNAGSVFVVPGSASPASTSLSLAPIRYDGPAASDFAGNDVYAGDLLGDGRLDLIIGAPFADAASGIDAGEVYVLPGGALASADLTAPPAGSAVYGGADAHDWFGWEVTVGDMIGDGRDELLTAAITPGGTAQVYVFGQPIASDPDVSSNPTATGAVSPQIGAQAGRALVAADVRGDAKDEMLVGSPYFDTALGADAGRMTVLSFLPLTTHAIYTGEAAGDIFGWDIVAADVTGSSRPDILVGALGHDPGGRTSAGRQYVLPMQDPIPASANPVTSYPGLITYDGDEASDLAGSTTAAGDLDGDLRADVIVGAELADPGGRGQAGSMFVVFGDNDPPAGVTLAAAPDPVEIGNPVTWTATGSDPQGGPVEFSFDIDGAPGFEIGYAAQSVRNRTYLQTGTFTGTVRVRDVGGATTEATDTVTVVFGEGSTDCSTGVPIGFGSGAGDTFSGGYGRQAYLGLGGPDKIEGGYGDDCLAGNAGQDTVDGGYDNDYVSGGPGADVLKGGYGNDLINAEDGSGNDTVSCGAGIDTARVDPGDSVSGCETIE